MIHVAVLKPGIVERILDGEKTVEARLYKSRREPFGRCKPGQRIYFKQSGGPFVATATLAVINEYENLSPPDIDRLRKQYAPTVGDSEWFWTAKRDARYACFLGLTKVKPANSGPELPPLFGRAWVCIPTTPRTTSPANNRQKALR